MATGCCKGLGDGRLRLNKQQVQLSEDRIRQEYPRNLDRFLGTENLPKEEVVGLVGDQYGTLHDLLFVSTIVSGLAGPTSDIDVFVLSDEYQDDIEQMVSLMFVGEKRLGVRLYSPRKVENAFATISAAGGSFLEVAATLNFRPNMSWRDVTRCLLGVNLNGEMPYLHNLPSAANIEFWLAFNEFREFMILAVAAERAGESKARIGYAIGGVLRAMNIYMASYGDIHGAEKWILERWQKFKNRTERADPDIQHIDKLWQTLRQALAGSAPEELSSQCIALYQQVLRQFDINVPEDLCLVSEQNIDSVGFDEVLTGLKVGVDAGNTVVISNGTLDKPFSLEDLLAFPKQQCEEFLLRVRSRQFHIGLHSLVVT